MWVSAATGTRLCVLEVSLRVCTALMYEWRCVSNDSCVGTVRSPVLVRRLGVFLRVAGFDDFVDVRVRSSICSTLFCVSLHSTFNSG